MPRKLNVIEEGDPMPKQPPAKVERQPSITMTGMLMGIDANIKGVNFHFERHIDDTADETTINEEVDLIARVIGRQNAKMELSEKMLALAIAQERIADAPERKTRELKALAEEKARTRMSFEIAHTGSGKRGEFRLTGPQQAALDSFDQRIDATGIRIEAEAANMKADIPLIEKQIARLRDIVEGRDPAEVGMEPLAEAAE